MTIFQSLESSKMAKIHKFALVNLETLYLVNN